MKCHFKQINLKKDVVIESISVETHGVDYGIQKQWMYLITIHG